MARGRKSNSRKQRAGGFFDAIMGKVQETDIARAEDDIQSKQAARDSKMKELSDANAALDDAIKKREELKAKTSSAPSDEGIKAPVMGEPVAPEPEAPAPMEKPAEPVEPIVKQKQEEEEEQQLKEEVNEEPVPLNDEEEEKKKLEEKGMPLGVGGKTRKRKQRKMRKTMRNAQAQAQSQAQSQAQAQALAGGGRRKTSKRNHKTRKYRALPVLGKVGGNKHKKPMLVLGQTGGKSKKFKRPTHPTALFGQTGGKSHKRLLVLGQTGGKAKKMNNLTHPTALFGQI